MREIKGLPTAILFNDRGLVTGVTGIRKIHANVVSILLTPIGTRHRQYTFGSKLTQYVMEPNDAFLEVNIKREIISALAIWEPRVNVLEIQVNKVDKTVNIGIQYQVKALDKTETLTLILEQGDII